MKPPPFLLYIVDDDEDDLLFLEAAFRELGLEHVCRGFLSGQEMLQQLQYSQPGELPDIIVLDYDIPRMSGREILKAIRKQPAFGNIPIIFYSDKISAETEKELKQLGAYCCIKKGVNLHDQIDFARTITGILKK